jgi:hypothetical protein
MFQARRELAPGPVVIGIRPPSHACSASKPSTTKRLRANNINDRTHAMTDKVPRPSSEDGLRYVQYELDKEQTFLDPIRKLISKDLSEPYSIYVYRYFLNQWGDLCYMVGKSTIIWVLFLT